MTSKGQINRPSRSREVFDIITQARQPQKTRREIHTTIKEKYLMKLINDGLEIHSDIISHVIAGCNAGGHLLDEHYGCWNGYVLKSSEFFSHDIDKCVLDHAINDQLLCYHGHIYYSVEFVESGVLQDVLDKTRDKLNIGHKPGVESYTHVNPDTTGLQSVYDKIKAKRSTDPRVGNDVFATSQEKYVIALIQERHNVPDAVITHVVEGCHAQAHLLDPNYGCINGYILQRRDFLTHDFEQCKSLHFINNKYLACYHGHLYYPVDMLASVFGAWQPEVVQDKAGVQKVYERIKTNWPEYHKYGNDMAMFTSLPEKYLIKRINGGEDIPEDVINHVVDYCEVKAHMLNKSYGCCLGFILTRAEYLQHDFKQCKEQKVTHMINEELQCCSGDLRYCEKYGSNKTIHHWCHPGTFRPRRNQTASIKEEPVDASVMRVYDMIKKMLEFNPRFSEDDDVYDIASGKELYLISILRKGENVPNEIISHVVYGCNVKGHLLDDNYGCCGGYILTTCEFMVHDFDECNSEHKINDKLNCKYGMVEHCFLFGPVQHLGGPPVHTQIAKDAVPPGEVPKALPPPAPAPPPLDYLDV